MPKNKDSFKKEYEPLLQWATPRQEEAVKSLIKYGSVAAAAEHVGMHPGRLRSHLSELKRRAAKRGWSPPDNMTKTVPEGFHVKGVSTYYDSEGNVKGQWVKSQKDQEHKIALLLDAVQEIAEPFAGKSVKVKAPKKLNSDLLCVYPMGDPHFNLKVWEDETGEEFDLQIAEATLVTAVDELVELAPPAEQALIINLGDFYHNDNQLNRTMRSGNVLDVDGRWTQMLAIGIRAMRRCIDRALEKHKYVTVINEIGNHDDHSAYVLSLVLNEYYSNNPRVTIDTSPETFHWFRFGQNLIGTTHGNNVKMNDLPVIMAQDRKQDWGDTEFRYWYTGHIHHDSAKEFPGCIVESFRTLAARDAYAHSHGYRSGRDMKLDVFHREDGRISRHIMGIKKILRAQKE